MHRCLTLGPWALLPFVVAACGGKSKTEPGLPQSCEGRTLEDVEGGHDLAPGYTAERDPRVAAWLAAGTTGDLVVEMQGTFSPGSGDPDYQDISRSPDTTLADGTVIRGYLFRDGSRGVNLDAGQKNRPNDGRNYSTAFPAESVRGAAWDLELEWELGEAIGDETMASLNDVLRGPHVDLVRHPYWGRAQDAYGEDPFHSGRLGSAFTAGVQAHVLACAEHWGAYNVEQGRNDFDAVVDEQTLREIYGRPFEMLVKDGGAGCVVAADNEVNGEKSAANAHLLRDILKGDVTQGGFGFRGFVATDLFGGPGGQMQPSEAEGESVALDMVNAGLDVEIPFTMHYTHLPKLVEQGRLDLSVLDDALGRILEQKARFAAALATDPYGRGASSSTLTGGSLDANPAHLALAERAELESAVLLANGPAQAPALPIPPGVRTVAVIGAEVPFYLVSSLGPTSCGQEPTRTCTFHFATDVALGDRGANGVNADPAQSIGPFDGIRAAAAPRGVNVIQGTSATDAANADFVVVVVGLTPGDEGEEYTIANGGDRASLDLPANQAELVSDVLALGKPTAVVVESGSIVNLPWLSDANQNQATIWAGYGGMHAGAALGKLLFGDANFSGKMPLAWPAESALPPFTDGDDEVVMSYWFGYRDYDRRLRQGEAVELVFPFGHGLSYTTFAYSHPVVPCAEVTPDAVLDVTVDVVNTGASDGDEVAFLFVEGPPSASEPRAVRELKSFERVHLPAGATQTVELPLRIRDLRHWSGDANGSWVLDHGDYTVLVGPSDSDDSLIPAGTFAISG